MKTELSELHKKLHKIFLEKVYDDPEKIDDTSNKIYSSSIACRVFFKLTEEDYLRQDCIGENLNQMILNLEENWFVNYKPKFGLDYYFHTYILQLYLFVERVDLIFKMLKKSGNFTQFNQFQEDYLTTFFIIKKWANFIKHPKEFLFTHWPKYYLEGKNSLVIEEGDLIVDTTFILSHYKHEGQPTPIILENNQRVFVEIPDLERITFEFCDELDLFFDFICVNQDVADFLKNKSTISISFDGEL